MIAVSSVTLNERCSIGADRRAVERPLTQLVGAIAVAQAVIDDVAASAGICGAASTGAWAWAGTRHVSGATIVAAPTAVARRVVRTALITRAARSSRAAVAGDARTDDDDEPAAVGRRRPLAIDRRRLSVARRRLRAARNRRIGIHARTLVARNRRIRGGATAARDEQTKTKRTDEQALQNHANLRFVQSRVRPKASRRTRIFRIITGPRPSRRQLSRSSRGLRYCP